MQLSPEEGIKPVQLPGVTLPAGRYRFQLADTQESRRVIKVQSEDGTKQLAMLLSVPNQLREIPTDPVVLFSETAQGEPGAITSYNYPGERTGYEFIYPHAQAVVIAHQTHQPVLSKDGDKIYRVDGNGNKVNEKGEAANWPRAFPIPSPPAVLRITRRRVRPK